MPIQHTIHKINTHLISTFAVLDSWFDHHDEFLKRKFSQAWNPAEILEHVMLTNHYLLLLIEKASIKARSRALNVDLATALEGYCFENAALEAVSDPQIFAWKNPTHMEPTSTSDLQGVRRELREQLYRCMCQLDLLSKGEGILCKTTMSVNDLGKLDVYQYLYFLSLHGQRHCRQLEKCAYLERLALAHIY